jgi:hypothetical protein
VDHADSRGKAVLGAGEPDGLAEHEHLSGIRRMKPGEDLPESALPGAVLAAQRVNGPAGDLEAHVVERHHPGETPGHSFEPYRGCRHGASFFGGVERASARARLRVYGIFR